MSELKIVEQKSLTNPNFQMIAAFANKKVRGPTLYIFNDGYQFQPYVASPLVADYTYIGRGCSDVSGEKFEPYMAEVLKTWSSRGQEIAKGNIYLNDEELSVPATPDEELARIRAYQGLLRYDPADWPEPYRSAFFESR